MIGNKVVARYRDGRVVKGVTTDFGPAREFFHLTLEGAVAPLTIRHADLKAVFFVRDFAGDPGHRKKNEFEEGKLATGKKLRVLFEDGEVLVGTTQGYQPGRLGFFLVPADPSGNCERCYVVAAATREVSFL